MVRRVSRQALASDPWYLARRSPAHFPPPEFLGGEVLPAMEDGFLSAPGFSLEGLLDPLQGFLEFGLPQAQGGRLLALGELRTHFADVE
jgi:hypothetical protein